MIRRPRKLPDPNTQWINPQNGRPTPQFYQYFKELDEAVRALIEAADSFETRISDLENP